MKDCQATFMCSEANARVTVLGLVAPSQATAHKTGLQMLAPLHQRGAVKGKLYSPRPRAELISRIYKHHKYLTLRSIHLQQATSSL
jgi:hypothetical protein